MNNETPKIAVDCIVLVPGGIVLIERKWPPLGYAIPGGFVDVGETLEAAAKREMKEELNLDVEIIDQLGIYDDPERDPRKHVISVVFVGKSCQTPVAGDDAKKCHVFRIAEIENMVDFPVELVFDHRKILQDYLDEGYPKMLVDDYIKENEFKTS